MLWSCCMVESSHFTRQRILDSSKLKEFADDNFKFDENGRKLSKQVENCGKRRNCLLRAISPFPTMLSKGLFPEASKGVIVWAWVNLLQHSPGFCDLVKLDLKTLWEKEKFLVTSIFSFSHSVFYTIKERNHHFSNIKFVILKCFHFGLVQKFCT